MTTPAWQGGRVAGTEQTNSSLPSAAQQTPTRPAPSNLEAALAYAADGWLVVPLHTPDRITGCSGRRGLACEHPGKHPGTRHGVKDASRDFRKIRRWWTRRPEGNIGGATGRISGRVIVDLDPRNGSEGSLA